MVLGEYDARYDLQLAGANAPKLDVVITIRDNSANEVCTIWPGHPLTAL